MSRILIHCQRYVNGEYPEEGRRVIEAYEYGFDSVVFVSEHQEVPPSGETEAIYVVTNTTQRVLFALQDPHRYNFSETDYRSSLYGETGARQRALALAREITERGY